MPNSLLARNKERHVGGKTLYFRRYAQGRLAAHVVGYSTVGRSRTGLERSLNPILTGSVRSLSSLVDQSLDKLNGRPIVVDGATTGELPGTVLRSGRDTRTVPVPAGA